MLEVNARRRVLALTLSGASAGSGHFVSAAPPEISGIGPKEAIPKLLRQTGIHQQYIGRLELNEAFASQVLAVMSISDLDPSRVKASSSPRTQRVIELGRAAQGVATIVHALKRRQLRNGMVSMCVGTGTGFAGD